MSANFLKKLPPTSLKRVISDKTELLRTVSGSTMEITGIYELPIRIYNHNRQIIQTFHIVPLLTEHCILGIDFISKNSVNFNGKTRKLTYKVDNNEYYVIGKLDRASIKNPPLTLVENKLPELRIEDIFSEIHRASLNKLIAANQDVVANTLSQLGRAVGVKHSIPKTGKVVFTQLRPVAHALQQIVRDSVEEMLTHNVIRPSVSPYSSPILLVKKSSSDERRFCIDFRKLNAETIKDKYPLPRIDVTIDYLYGAKIFTTLDLFSGYWQIEIEDYDKFKTAFTTEDGHFEFNRMPFGLTNAPATFQRLLNTILRPVLKKIALVYLDDVIIFSKTIDEHLRHIQIIFDLFRRAGLKIKPAKCTFLQKSVKYLGHIVSHKGIQPDPKKTDSIKKYPTPKNADHLRSFLGLAGYYRKFVKNYADKAHPLTILTRKDTEWIWAQQQEDAFQFLKNCLLSPPILRYPNFAREFILHTDASGFGVGAVLAQMHWDEGTEKEVVIAYTSQHLNDTQVKWSTIEKEAYAIIHAVNAFYHYLYGRKFKIFTDHRPLQWLMTLKNPTGKLARWALLLQEFDIEISYRPGKTNQNADCLSRIPVPEKNDQILSPEIPTINFVTKEFAAEQLKDSYCRRARERFTREKTLREELSTDVQSNLDKTIDEIIRTERNREKSPHRENYQDSAFSSDDDCNDDEISTPAFIELHNGLIGTKDGKILVPESLKDKVLKRFHNSPYAGHLGVKKTTERIQRRFKWPRMAKDIKDYIRKCEICAKRKAVGSSRAPLQPLPPPDHVWQMMAMDLMGPLNPPSENFSYILVMGEYMTKYIITAPLVDQTAESVAKAFVQSVILQHGVPERVLTDLGSNFQSEFMDILYKQFGIHRLRTTAYRPQCDGMVERVNRTLADMLASYVSNHPDRWSTFLPFVTFAYNTAVHTSTGFTPFYLMYGREAREPSDMMPPARLRTINDDNMIYSQMWHDAIDLAKDKLHEAQEAQKLYYDKYARQLVTYKVGDTILLREMANTPGKFNMRWDGPFKVLEQKSDVTYKVTPIDSDGPFVTHVDRMKPFSIPPSPITVPVQTEETETHDPPPKRKRRRRRNNKKTQPDFTNQTRYTLRNTVRRPQRFRE